MKNLYMLATTLLLQACSSLGPAMTSVNVLSKGSDPPDAFCNKFTLSDAQASELLKRSREIEADEFHDSYDYLPCFVKGRLLRKGIECEFTIRAGGTVEMVCNDDTGYLYVCDRCDDLLRDSN